MRDDKLAVVLAPVPKEYDPVFFNQAFRNLEIHLNNVLSRGPVRVSAINVSDLPTSSSGLKSGDLWSDSGTVKVVS